MRAFPAVITGAVVLRSASAPSNRALAAASSSK
jgi:hypothetical protein